MTSPTWLEVSGGAIRTCRLGPRASQNGTTWVCLHGYPDTLRVFEPLAEALPEAEFLLFDWPGQGKSADLRLHDPWDRARFLAKLLDASGKEKISLFAHDMGVLPALAFAALFPGRAERLVLSHALLDDRGPVSAEIRLLRGAKLYPLAFELAPRLVFARCLATFLGEEHALDWAAISEMRGDFIARRRTITALAWAYDAALPTFLDTIAREARALPPIHLVWSARAHHFPVAHARALQARVPSARLTLTAAAPHWLVCAAPGKGRGEIVEIMRHRA